MPECPLREDEVDYLAERPLREDEVDDWEEWDVKVTLPSSYTVTITIHRDESRLLTEAARQRDLELGDFIKRAALEVAERVRSRAS